MELSAYLFSGTDLARGSVDDDGDAKYVHLAQNVPDGSVVGLQQDLLDLGFDGVGTPDGAFGNSTRTALLSFQKKAAIPQSGVVDATTRMTIAAWILGGHTRTNPLVERPAPHRAGRNKFVKPRVGHFSQGDPKWARRVLGKNKSIQKAGCAITCVSMILRHYGRPVDPGSLDAFLDANGGYVGDSVVWGVAAKCEARGRKKLEYGRFEGKKAAVEKRLRSRLKANKPTMVRVDYENDHDIIYNHFVLAVGQTPDGEIIINDPATWKGDGYADAGNDNIIEKTSRKGGYETIRLDWYDPA